MSIKDMAYYVNENARSGKANYGHEAAVADKIKAAGFIEIDKKEFPKITKAMLKKWARTGTDDALRKVTKGMAVGSYILQPAGSQGLPDVLILDFDNRFVGLECKSTKRKGPPMWNDSLPNPNIIYILASGVLDKTTIFLGKDVITDTEVDLQLQFWDEVKALQEKYKKLMELEDKFGRGFCVKGRPQNFQFGGENKVNYFAHKDMAVCEANALAFARGAIENVDIELEINELQPDLL